MQIKTKGQFNAMVTGGCDARGRADEQENGNQDNNVLKPRT
jgi:hypothetical protein